MTLHGRYAMTIRFNQAVGRAEDLTCYSIQSEDIWDWHVKVKQAIASADGRSVSLYTEPLYQGTYTIKLNKMTSAMTAANVSDSGIVYRFTVEDWPKDRAFYLARFRLPAIILGGLLVVLAAAALLRGRKERTEEKPGRSRTPADRWRPRAAEPAEAVDTVPFYPAGHCRNPLVRLCGKQPDYRQRCHPV